MAIQVQLLISINGGAYNPGTQEGIAPASTVALKAGVNGGLLNAIRYEIYEYPPGMACPAGWAVDPTTVSATSTGVYVFAPSNVTTQPPSFSLPPSGAQNWGWTMIRLIGNNNPAQINQDGTQNTQFTPSLTDLTGCINVVSPVLHAKGIARGLTTQDDGLRSWAGALMQSLRAMDSAASGASFSAGGDLAGSGISQTVVGLRGNPLSLVAPTAGQFLVESAGASGSAWTSISGDVSASGTTPGKLTVTGIQGSAVPTPATGFLQWTGAAFAWSTPAGGFTAGGDLGGTSTNQSVLAVHGASVPSAGGLVTGNVLQVVGSSALSYGAVNLAGGSGSVTGLLPAGNQAAQTMGGDVTGTTAASVVAKVNGATVPAAGALTPGNVLQVLSAGGLTYGTVNLSNPNSVSGSVGVAQGGTGLSAIGTADQLLGVNHTASALAYFTPGGDATLASGNFTVIGLQGFSVANTPPTSGQVLTWNAGTSKWTATTPGSGASVTGSGDWHSTAGALDAAASHGTAGQFRTTNAGASDTAWTTLSGDVSASVSTVGQITVTALQSRAVSSTAPTAGQFLIENAGASSWVPTSLSQDVSASLVTPGALTVVGIRTVSVPALASGYLQYTGTVFAWTTPANSSVTGSGVWHSTAGVLDAAASKGTAGQFLVTNAGATDTSWVSLSADVTASTGTPGAITVVAIRGNPVTVTAATAGQVLIENAGATASAWTSFSGDVTLATATPGLATVVGLKGQTIPTLASGWLQWNGSALVWSTPPGAFTAGGDLSGTNTSQTVIGIQGRAVASTAPTNGQVLEWNNGASQWQPTNLPSGTSVTGSGFWHSASGTLDAAANKGTAGQFAVTNAGATDTSWVSISGDATNATATAGKLTVTGIQGNPVSATAATAGQVLVENAGATASAWTSFSGDVSLSTSTVGKATVVAIQGNAVSATAATAGQVLVENSGATGSAWTTLSQDVTLSTSTPGQASVVGIRGNAVPALASGFLQWTGSAFAWTTPAGLFTAGHDLSGTATSQTVVGIQGNPVSATAATAGQFLVENSGATGSAWTTLSGDGLLSTSTAGKLTVVAIQGNAVSGTAATAGQFLVENSGATGSAWTSLSGDASNSTSAAGKVTVTGLQGNPVSATAATAGQLLIENSGATGSAWTSFSGDVSLSASTVGQAKVTGIQGNAVSATAATAGQFLIENSGATGSAWTSISGDASASTSTTGQLTVTGLQGHAVPSPTTGFLQWNGSAYAWSTATGITQLTGDVLAGPGGGSQVATVVAISGTSPIAITPNSLQWLQSATGPTLSQAQQANASAPANFTIAPQAPGAAATNATNGTPASLVVSLATPVNGGSEAFLTLTRGGTTIAAFGHIPTFTAAGGAWFQQATPSSTNYCFAGDSTGNSSLNGVQVGITVGGHSTVQLLANANGIQLFNGFGLVPTFGGGTNIVAFADATAVPTSVTSGYSFLYSHSGSLEVYASGLQFHQLGTPAILQVGATTDVTPQNLVITPQAPFASATTTAHKTPGSVVVNLPLPVSGGADGTLQVQRNGTMAASIDAQGVVVLVNTSSSQSGHSNAATIWSATGGSLTLLPSTSSGLLLYSGDQTTSVAITSGQVAIGGTTSCNVLVNGAAAGGGLGVLALKDANTVPTSVPSGSVATYSHNVGGTSFLGIVGRGITFSAAMTAVTINQQPIAGAADGNPLVIAAQSAGAGGGNHIGGQLGLLGGQPSGSGGQGSVVMGTPDLTSGLVTASGAGVAIQSGGSNANPTTALTIGAASGALAIAADGSGTSFVYNQLSYVVAGTKASQQAFKRRFFDPVQLTSSGVTQILNVPIPISGTIVTATITLQGRVTIPGTGTAVGDYFMAVYEADMRNFGGVLGAAFSATFVSKTTAISSASGLSFGGSGTNVQVNFQMTTASGTLGTVDGSIWVEAFYN
jgi:hypothetical protein